jgi:hypothetical protein
MFTGHNLPETVWSPIKECIHTAETLQLLILKDCQQNGNEEEGNKHGTGDDQQLLVSFARNCLTTRQFQKALFFGGVEGGHTFGRILFFARFEEARFFALFLQPVGCSLIGLKVQEVEDVKRRTAIMAILIAGPINHFAFLAHPGEGIPAPAAEPLFLTMVLVATGAKMTFEKELAVTSGAGNMTAVLLHINGM